MNPNMMGAGGQYHNNNHNQQGPDPGSMGAGGMNPVMGMSSPQQGQVVHAQNQGQFQYQQQQQQQQLQQQQMQQQQMLQQQQFQAQQQQQQLQTPMAGATQGQGQNPVGPAPSGTGTIAVNPQQQQAREVNAVTLCRLGQETVQEIISRMQELFQTLKSAQPPDGKYNPALDRRPKFQETLRNLKATYKRLRLVHEKLEESFPSDKVINFEAEILQKSELDSPTTPDDKRNTEAYRQAVEEYREVAEHVVIKNRHLKETIDQLRQIVWDVNTMLSMRKD